MYLQVSQAVRAGFKRYDGTMVLPLLAATVFCLGISYAQEPPRHDERKDVKLPSGKSQTEEILKEEHKKSLEDARELIRLSEELKTELDKNDRHIVSVAMLKRLEEMEKRVKRIRGRLTRY